jgi:hypothetical protein
MGQNWLGYNGLNPLVGIDCPESPDWDLNGWNVMWGNGGMGEYILPEGLWVALLYC